MKTTTVKMSQIKGKNVFAGVEWKDATFEEQSKIFATLARMKQSNGQI